MHNSLKRRGGFFGLQFLRRAFFSTFLFCTLLVSTQFAFATNAAADAAKNEAWKILANGKHVILLRHASTVAGVGDPPGFILNDCATQRNLSAEGRAQAGRWRATIAEHNILIGDVLTSEWCRCVDTAQLAFGATGAAPKKWDALNSFFSSAQAQSAQANQTAAIKKRLPALLGLNKNLGKNVVLVTHQVNITALTGIVPQAGEAVVIALDSQRQIKVVAQLWVE